MNDTEDAFVKKTLTVRYTLQQMAYWAAAAGILSFASAFLLEKGFTTAQVGTLLASGNILSCIVQPILADRADRSGAQMINRYIVGLTVLCGACFTVIQLLPLPQWLFGLLYLMGVFTFDAMMPLLNSVCVAYNQQSYKINYGVGRGIGSFAYSLAALAIGKVIAGMGADWMIWIVLVLLAANVAVTLGYPHLDAQELREKQVSECCSIPVFFKRYKWYCVSLLGVMLLAMFHAMTENYLIKIMGRLGGDSGSVGVALFIATAIEMPVILWFDTVRKHIPDNRLLKLAGLSFLLKAVLFLIAPSVTSIYLIQLLQATSYSFLSPTQLYYANAKVQQADMVKGQAFITASYTLGCAIGNFTGGQLLAHFNVVALLIAGIVMAAAGTLVLFLTVDRKDCVAAE
jgi:PPP family 3-phenylpropionic acid transporter